MTNAVKNWRTQEAPERDPKKHAVKRVGQAIKGLGGTEFEDNPVDLGEVQRAYHTDSYIRRAIDKYAGLMFKQGWDFIGRNESAVEYVWTRFKLMAEGTQKPMDILFSDLAFDYILYGNAFLVKARAKGTNTSGINATGYTGKQPIAGYFVLPAATITVARDDNGTITGYQQEIGGGEALVFKKEDVIHLTYRRPTGRAYGVPIIFNVLDDVQILRQLEENVARLVYRNLFPLYQYQVGLDKPGYEATDEEIEMVREEIRDMPMDGGLVVPERHNITVVGSEGQAIDAEPYLKYYRQRVFTGLGMSDSVMGVGDTSNRSTSDNQASDLFDAVKEFQRTFAEQVQFSIINEILFEGGFDPTMNSEDEVKFFFEEIELDAKTKKENHAVQMFMQNAISHDEMREEIGRDPISDEARLHFNMIGGGIDKEAADKAEEGASNAGNNKDQPENQHGKQSSPGKPEASEKGDSFQLNEKKEEKVLTGAEEVVTFNPELPIEKYHSSMRKFWSNLTGDVVQMLEKDKSLNEIKGFATELIRQSLRAQNRQYINSALSEGIGDGIKEVKKPITSTVELKVIVDRVAASSEKHIDRLIDDMNSLIESATLSKNKVDSKSSVVGAFKSNEYRLSLIANTELYRAYNYGKVVVALEAKLDSVHVAAHHGCADCQSKSGTVLLQGMDTVDALPPHHPNCICIVQLNNTTEEV